MPRRDTRAVRAVLLILLAAFYVVAATTHARVVNLSKARGDQSGYLWDAEQVYANWHGQPGHLIGQRMRMPMYAGYLAFFYSPRLSDPEFFDVAKPANIWLSVGLLAGLAIAVAWLLPPLLSMNLTLIVAFGYFVFKAGYAQPELLFYFLMFQTFLAAWYLLAWRRPISGLFLGIAAGALAGLTHLTKAVMPPFLALFGIVYVGQALVELVRRRDRSGAVRSFVWQMLTVTMMAVSFLAVVFPYIINSKRTFGEYFYNVNTAAFVWYDTGAMARGLLMPRMDEAGRIDVPSYEVPSARSYWRTHSVGEIAARIGGGLDDMIVGSYNGYGYLKYAALYVCGACLMIAANRRAFLQLLAEHGARAIFLAGYAVVYLTSTAFFSITSGTGDMRFLLAHVAPFFFVLSCLFARAPFRETTWSIGGLNVSAAHFHLFVSTFIAWDLLFLLWPQLMTTYSGF